MKDSVKDQLWFYFNLFLILCLGVILGTILTTKHYSNKESRSFDIGYNEGQKSIMAAVRGVGICNAKKNLDAIGIEGTTPPAMADTTPKE